jgi:hypothetical protein
MITQVDCGAKWKGEAESFQEWSKYQATPGVKTAVAEKLGM